MKNKTTAGVLALALGSLGAHRFYLGQTKWGILYLVFCWTYIPMLIGFIDGLLFLIRSDADFDGKYNPNQFAPNPVYTPVSPPQYKKPQVNNYIGDKPSSNYSPQDSAIQNYEREKETKTLSPVQQVESDIIDVSFVAIDFETANRRRGSACAIGMSKVVKGVVVDSYVKYLRPEPFEFETHNTYIHGINAEMTEDAPTIEDDWLNIRHFVDGLPLVAHNASFDKSVLEQSLEASGGMASGWLIDCTMKRAKELLPNRTSYKLPDLCREYGIELKHHNAGSDAEACARLQLKLMTLQPTIAQIALPTPAIERTIVPQSEVLKGLTMVFTGSFDEYTRTEIEELAASHGAQVRGSVSGKTDYVVRGAISQSGKLSRAYELGVSVLSVKQFLKLIEKGLLKKGAKDCQITDEDIINQLNSSRAMVSRLKRQLKDLGESATQERHTNYTKYQKLITDLTRWEAQKADLEMAKGGVYHRNRSTI